MREKHSKEKKDIFSFLCRVHYMQNECMITIIIGFSTRTAKARKAG